MRIFVTGATGYIGQYVSASLRFDGHEVVGLTRDPRSRRSLELASLEVLPVEGALEDPDTYRNHVRWADAVVHCALDEGDSLGSDRRLFSALVAEERMGGRRRHLIYTTGCSVYGTRGHHSVLTESTPVDPSSWRAQLESELASSGLWHTILRPGFVYGGNGRRSITGQWFADAEQNRPQFFGDTSKQWSWIHVYDLADAYVRSLRHPSSKAGEIYCIADSDPSTALAAFQACVRAAGCAAPMATLPIEKAADSLRIFDHDEVIDSAKARDQLGWTARQPSLLVRAESTYRGWKAANS